MKTGVTPESQDLIDRVTFILSMESGFLWNDVYASTQIDELARDFRVSSVLSKANGLLRLRQTQVILWLENLCIYEYICMCVYCTNMCIYIRCPVRS